MVEGHGKLRVGELASRAGVSADAARLTNGSDSDQKRAGLRGRQESIVRQARLPTEMMRRPGWLNRGTC